MQTGCFAKVADEGPPVTTVLASVYDSLDVISVFIFAVLGGLLAVRRQLPLPLVMLSGLLTGLGGGGGVRDLIIEAPPVALHRPDYLARRGRCGRVGAVRPLVPEPVQGSA